jgi:hypothetical protein
MLTVAVGAPTNIDDDNLKPPSQGPPILAVETHRLRRQREIVTAFTDGGKTVRRGLIVQLFLNPIAGAITWSVKPGSIDVKRDRGETSPLRPQSGRSLRATTTAMSVMGGIDNSSL